MARHPAFVAPMLSRPDARHALCNERTGQTVAGLLEGAFDSQTRRKGLLGRDALAPGRAIVIAPCNSVHTFFMRFAIDVVFVRRSGEVVKVCPRVPAWRMRAALRAFAVVELPAGTLDACPVAPGDRLAVVEAASTGD